jgi:hypothetical protein
MTLRITAKNENTQKCQQWGWRMDETLAHFRSRGFASGEMGRSKTALARLRLNPNLIAQCLSTNPLTIKTSGRMTRYS